MIRAMRSESIWSLLLVCRIGLEEGKGGIRSQSGKGRGRVKDYSCRLPWGDRETDKYRNYAIAQQGFGDR